LSEFDRPAAILFDSVDLLLELRLGDPSGPDELDRPVPGRAEAPMLALDRAVEEEDPSGPLADALDRDGDPVDVVGVMPGSWRGIPTWPSPRTRRSSWTMMSWKRSSR